MDTEDKLNDVEWYYKMRLQYGNAFIEYIHNENDYENVEDNIIDQLDVHHNGTVADELDIADSIRIKDNIVKAKLVFSNLSIEDQQYFMLYLKHGRYKELAAATGVSLSTAWKRIADIKEQLKQLKEK